MQNDLFTYVLTLVKKLKLKSNSNKSKSYSLIIDLFSMFFSGITSVVLIYWRGGVSKLITSNPFSYSGDYLFFANLVKNAQDGNLIDGHTLGGSLGQDFHLNSFGIWWIPMWIAGHFGSGRNGPWLAMFNWWLFSYFLLGLSSYFALRLLRLPKTVAFIGSISFALIPQHSYFLGELPFSNMVIIPPFIAILFLILQGNGFDSLIPKSWHKNLNVKTNLGRLVVALIFALGLTGENYYLVFTFQISLSCTLLLLTRKQWWCRAKRMFFITCVSICSLAVVYAPIIYSRLALGLNPIRDSGLSDRRAFAAYFDGGDPFSLLLPFRSGFFYNFLNSDTTIAKFFFEKDATSSLAPYSTYQAGLGFILLIGLIFFSWSGIGSRLTFLRNRVSISHSVKWAFAGLAVMIGWYIRGGFGTFFAFLFPQAREYEQVIIFITFSSIALIGLFSMQKSKTDRIIRLIAIVSMVLVLIDSVSANSSLVQIQGSLNYIPSQISQDELPIQDNSGFGLTFNQLGFASTRSLVSFANKTLNQNCTILEIPLVQFPIDFGLGVVSFRGYEELKPGLQPSNQHWTAGGITSNPNNKFIDSWMYVAASNNFNQFLDVLTKYNYCGVAYFGNLQDIAFKAGVLNGSRFTVSDIQMRRALNAKFGVPCWKNTDSNVYLYCLTRKTN